MIIKDVFIREHPVCPRPNDMQMLRFVQVPTLVIYVKPSEPEQGQENSNAYPELDSRKLNIQPRIFDRAKTGRSACSIFSVGIFKV